MNPFATIPVPATPEGRHIFKHSHGMELALCVKQPTKKRWENAPFVLLIVGGGWWNDPVGDTPTGTFAASQATPLLEAGWGLVTVQFAGVGNQELMQDILGDILDGVGYLQHYQELFRLDCHRILTTGVSAPAHLSLMLAMAPHDLLTRGCTYPVDFTVIGCIACNAPCILYPVENGKFLYFNDRHDGYYQVLMGGSYTALPEVHRTYSPITYADQPHPPLFIVYSGDDSVVPPEQSIRLVKACQKAGTPLHTVCLQKNGDHGLNATPGKQADPDKATLLTQFFAYAQELVE